MSNGISYSPLGLFVFDTFFMMTENRSCQLHALFSNQATSTFGADPYVSLGPSTAAIAAELVLIIINNHVCSCLL